MHISGLQKLTLLDYPGRVACTVFLNGCNFACPFCHNSHLLSPQSNAVLTAEELLSFLKRRKGILDGVCISGGEPTIHPELLELLGSIKAQGYLIKLDTNGSHPEILRSALDEGLVDYVAMDVKNSPAKYAQTVGLPAIDLSGIEESLGLLLNGTTEYELRTTVVSQFHSEASILEMGRWVEKIGAGKRAAKWFIQPFADRETVPVSGLFSPEQTVLESFLTLLAPYAEQLALRGC